MKLREGSIVIGFQPITIWYNVFSSSTWSNELPFGLQGRISRCADVLLAGSQHALVQNVRRDGASETRPCRWILQHIADFSGTNIFAIHQISNARGNEDVKLRKHVQGFLCQCFWRKSPSCSLARRSRPGRKRSARSTLDVWPLVVSIGRYICIYFLHANSLF